MPERFLTLIEVIDRVCFSKTHIYRKISEGTFPRQIPLGPQKIAFLESEIEAWMAMRVQARDLTRDNIQHNKSSRSHKSGGQS